MFCKTHSERSGVNTCGKCGEWLCSECSVEIDGRVYCKSCIAGVIGGSGYKKVDTRSSGRHSSWILLFIFSFILPGINYMYLGLTKRGLFILSAALLSIYISATMNTPLFALITGVTWVASIFDGFQIRRRLMAGEMVSDDVEDIKSFFKRNKNSVLLGSMLIVAISIVQFVEKLLWRMGMSYSSASVSLNILPLAILGFGIYALMKARKPSSGKKPRKDSDSDDDSLN